MKFTIKYSPSKVALSSPFTIIYYMRIISYNFHYASFILAEL